MQGDIWKEISRADLLFLTSDRPALVGRAYRNALVNASPFHVEAALRNILPFRDLALLPANVKAALDALAAFVSPMPGRFRRRRLQIVLAALVR